jgi:hypothetical protein
MSAGEGRYAVTARQTISFPAEYNGVAVAAGAPIFGGKQCVWRRRLDEPATRQTSTLTHRLVADAFDRRL